MMNDYDDRDDGIRVARIALETQRQLLESVLPSLPEDVQAILAFWDQNFEAVEVEDIALMTQRMRGFLQWLTRLPTRKSKRHRSKDTASPPTRQRVLTAVAEWQHRRGSCPTAREVQEVLDLSSGGLARYHLRELERLGWVTCRQVKRPKLAQRTNEFAVTAMGRLHLAQRGG